MFGFKLFKNVPFWFFSIFYTIAGLSYATLGAIVVVLSKDFSTGISISYALLLITAASQLFFSGGFLTYSLYSDTFISKAVVNVLNLYPSFHFSSALSRMIWYFDNHFNILTRQWLPGH